MTQDVYSSAAADRELGMVYVVDDDPPVCNSVNRLMGSVDIPVETFASPTDFVSKSKWHRPSCFVLDVTLPGRSGLDIQSDLARRDATMPIISSSGYADVPISVRARKAGAVEFILKPGLLEAP